MVRSTALISSLVNIRALTHDHYWPPPTVRHFSSGGLSNTNIRCGAINEKCFQVNKRNSIAEADSMKQIPVYIPVLYSLLYSGWRSSVCRTVSISGISYIEPSSSSTRRSHFTHKSCGSFESTRKRSASLCKGDGREDKLMEDLQTVLWRRQSVFRHFREHYAIEWHDKQDLESAPLQIIQVGFAIP